MSTLYSSGKVTAYGAAVDAGYTGTYAQFAQAQADLATEVATLQAMSATASTLAAGSDATASYDHSTGVISIGIPQGIPGDVANVAADFNSSDTYAAGDYCIYNSQLYQFKNDHAGVWDADDVEAVAVCDILKNKANIDGYYEELTAGNAEQLISNVGVEESTPYLFRPTGGSADVGDRLQMKQITGGTVAWNQLVNTGDTSVTVQNEHKYYSRINGVQTIGKSTGAAISINDADADNVFDLTQMFGTSIADYLYTLESATPGAGIAKLKSWGFCTKDYYEYNAGALQNVKTSAHKTVGFNAYNHATGIAKVLGGNVYQITGAYTALTLNGETVTPDASGYFTPTANGELTVTGGNATDTCIHLKWDGERDGEYEPYEEHTYALDSDLELRGIPKLDANNNLYYDGDVYESDGTVTRRYGIVDLGTLNWSYSSTNQYFGTNDLSSTIKDSTSPIGIMCSRYIYKGRGATGTIGAAESGTMWTFNTNIRIKDLTYDDAVTFKSAMSGVYLVYELATPTTETAEPYQETQVCDDFGTEEFEDSRDVPVPVGYDVLYQANLRAKLEMAPDSPDGDGDYIVRQTNGLNEYVPLSGNSAISGLLTRCPACPTDTDGTFALKATVSDGNVTYSWVSE